MQLQTANGAKTSQLTDGGKQRFRQGPFLKKSLILYLNRDVHRISLALTKSPLALLGGDDGQKQPDFIRQVRKLFIVKDTHRKGL